ncbi:hypothetical protein M3193_02725 [Sporosarcina luteola]|uniref:YpoC family protein n=1 Tax=Sporosarcina luteola TaxID=582850 RepID=UPI002040BA5A|nr:hypothetical protein [Sporosarcina luteola]MCM3743049.1 hypothetical protein [Sporosarcina luteola]
MHKSELDRKALLYSHWDNWLDMKERIEEAYKQKDPEAANLLDMAIDNYVELIRSFKNDDSSSSVMSQIEPLNGEERLQFIRTKRAGHFAYVQLDALYTEAMKKAVSRLAMIE